MTCHRGIWVSNIQGQSSLLSLVMNRGGTFPVFIPPDQKLYARAPMHTDSAILGFF